MKATTYRLALVLIAVVMLLSVAMTRYSGFAFADPGPSRVSEENLFLARGIACRRSATRVIAGSMETGVFVSLSERVRELRAKIVLGVRAGGSPVQHLRQEYKALKERKSISDSICAAGPDQIQALAKVTKMSLSTRSFANNGTIPDIHSCWQTGEEDPGEGQSPPLTWKNLPKKATRLALLVYDKDADFIHWFMIIEKKSSWFSKGLPQDVPDEAVQDIKNSFQDANDFGIQGYSGPCPPEGENHRYVFELIALNAGARGTSFGDDAVTIKRKLKKNTIITATLTGLFIGKVDSDPPTEVPDLVSPHPTATPTRIPTPTAASWWTPTPTATVTSTPTATFTNTRTPTPTATPTITMTPTPGPLRDVTDIVAGYNHTCALMRSGGVKCWGYNYAGQLGNGSSGGLSLVPVNVSGLSSGVTQITAGADHTCALLDTGAVKCWGYSNYGQIGDGTSGTNRLTPVNVSGLSSGVTKISAGGEHTCALLSAGEVKCWGSNTGGQIGDGTSGTARRTPVSVSGLSSGVTQIAAGGEHTCALLSAGGMKCWGYNGQGQIGNGSSGGNVLVPVSVSGLASGVARISNTCALLTTGGVKCWGYNFRGRIGDGTSGNFRLVPVDVVGLSSGVSRITEGGGHTCALLVAGGLKCWGDNFYGSIGDGTSVTEVLTPVNVSEMTAGVSSITAGSDHTCALLGTGEVKCWGHNGTGQIGDGTQVNRRTPVLVRVP